MIFTVVYLIVIIILSAIISAFYTFVIQSINSTYRVWLCMCIAYMYMYSSPWRVTVHVYLTIVGYRE